MNDPAVSNGSETASPQVDARQRLWHDLRGRLNSVLGFAQLMLDGKVGPLAPQHAEFLGDIHTSAREMLGLIDEAASGEAHASRPASPPERPAAAELTLETAKAGARVPTILIVEDDAADAVWLEQVLGDAGYVAEIAATGAEAVARARESRYDGITLDLLLPDMTGWDIVREIRQDGPNVDTPIVVVSVTPQRVAAAGFVVREVVQKPARPEELLNALHRVGVPANEGRPILIVENNRGSAKLAAAVLRLHGYRPVWRAEGASALSAIDEVCPEAIMLDLMMPGMSGFEFLELLRRRPTGRSIPVIVWTAKSLTVGESEKLRASAQAVVSKHGADGIKTLIDAISAQGPVARG